jgi:hypothetical protein
MPTVYEAAGGNEGLLRLARAWHARVVADEGSSCSPLPLWIRTTEVWSP